MYALILSDDKLRLFCHLKMKLLKKNAIALEKK